MQLFLMMVNALPKKLKLNNANVVLRVVKIKITRVINIHKEPELQSQEVSSFHEYIGRGFIGELYSMFENGDSREEVIRNINMISTTISFQINRRIKSMSLQEKAWMFL